MPDENQRSEDVGSDKKDTNISDENQKKDDSKSEGKTTEAKDKKQGEGEEMISVSKKDWNKLNAKNRKEKKGDKSERMPKSLSKGKFSFEEPKEEEKPSIDELVIQEREEYAKLKSGVADLLFDNEDYQKVLKSDRTLTRVLRNDPLSLIDFQPMDANDALNGIKEYLDELVEDYKDKDDKSDTDDKGSTSDKGKKVSKPAPQEPKDKKEEKTDIQRTQAQGMSDIEASLKSKVKIPT